MKKSSKFYLLLYISCLTFLCTGCNDYLPMKNGTVQEEHKDFSMDEAQEFFEQQMLNTIQASRTESHGKRLVNPGNFTPLWEQSVPSEKGKLMCYDVPMETTMRYKVMYATFHNGKATAHNVNLYQKLVIVKNKKTGNRGTYILNLIPEEGYENEHPGQAATLFVNCGNKGGFSGVAFYSVPNLNRIIRVNRYKEGNKTKGVFLFGKNATKDKADMAHEILKGMIAKGKEKTQTRAFGETDWWEEDDDDNGFTYTDKDGNTCDMKEFDGTTYPYIDLEKGVEEDNDTNNDENEKWMDETRPGGIDWEDPDEEEEEDNDYYNSNIDNPQDDKNETEKKEEEKNKQELKEAIDNIRPILKKIGIDIDKYKICRTSSKGMCDVNARVLPDKTIELCSQFFKYEIGDQASIVWHEIYHIDQNHHAGASSNGIIIELPTPPDDILKGINIHIDWLNKDLINDYAIEIIKQGDLESYLNIGKAYDSQWYINEIDAYTRELDNGLAKSQHYEGLINFNLWRFNEVINIINEQKNK